MRCSSVAAAKGKKTRPIRAEPCPGSHIREIYDLFKARPGEPVEFKQFPNDTSSIVKLTDFYGLDIRKLQQGSKRTGRPSLYVLAGEWFGRVYVDYVAQRIDQSNPLTSEPSQADVSATPAPPIRPARLAGVATTFNSMRS